MITRLIERALPAWHALRSALDPGQRQLAGGFGRRRAELYQRMWQRAATALGAELVELGYGYHRIRRGGRSTIVARGEVMLDSRLALEVAGNKPLVHRLLRALEVPIPRFLEFELRDLGAAAEFLRELRGPAVVKPASASAGQGVTTQVCDVRDLVAAATWAARFGRPLLIEEQHPGRSYRLLYLGGAFLDAIRREPPVVFGDGRQTITELLGEENRRRLEGPVVTALSPLTPDPDTHATLRAWGLALTSVPPRHRPVTVKRVVNQNSARENHVVRELHPEVVRLGRQIATSLGLELVGVDVMTTDIGAPLAETGGVINEVNTTPGLHHHVLVAEPEHASPVAESILEYVLRSGHPASY